MDVLIQRAQELAQQQATSYLPIKNRVAYVVSHGQSYASNGYAIRTQGIAKALNMHGLETLCFVRQGRPWDFDAAADTTYEKVVNDVRYFHSPWPEIKKPKSEFEQLELAAERLVELFQIYRPKYVLAGSNWENAFPAWVAAKRLGLPFHYEVRGFWEVSRVSRYPDWENTQDFARHYECETWICNQADAVFTLNVMMKRELIRRGVAAKRIEIVPNSVAELPRPRKVDASNLRRVLGLPEDAFTLGYVGALTEYEGLESIPEALSILGDKSIYALIIGGHNPVGRNTQQKTDPVAEKILEKAKLLGVEKNIIFTGRVPHDELDEIFQLIDVAVLPRSPLPVCELVSAIKPLEYLARGKPLIASDIEPQLELLSSQDIAWLFKKGDSASFAEMILQVKNSPEDLVAEKIKRGKAFVEKKFLWKHSVRPVVRYLSGYPQASNVPKFACIMDEFTYQSYSPEAEFYQLTPQHWLEELSEFQPDYLFIESAWRGKDELWGSKVGHKSQELQGIVEWCNKQNVPTIFWNKEDPVHFETFLNTAKLFDFVFTTDLDCIHRYKAALGHNRVYFLPFACQPKHTNPIETYDRKDAFCFAGAYYVKYPDRTKDLETFVEAFPKYKPLAIYDRNYGKNDPNYMFPENYQQYIVGTLPFSEIDKAYKGYRYAINLNSIKQSQTMFARRVYELLGSNTITVSNFSRGVRLLFGDLVLTSDDGAEIVRRLQAVECDQKNAEKFRLTALRKVLSEHTYKDRLNYVLSKVTNSVHAKQLPNITAISVVSTSNELLFTMRNVSRQQFKPAKLVLFVKGETLKELSIKNAVSDYFDGLVAIFNLSDLGNEQLCSFTQQDSWVAAFSTNDYYGPNYLLDMALATQFTDAKIIGKCARYLMTSSGTEFINAKDAYTKSSEIPRRAAIIAPELQKRSANTWLEALDAYVYQGEDTQAVDAFNYCQNVAQFQANSPDSEVFKTLQRIVDDAEFDVGLPLSALEQLAENTAAAKEDVLDLPSYTADELQSLFSGVNTTNCSLEMTTEGMVVTSKLGDGKHEYIYANTTNLRLADFSKGGIEQGKLPLHLEMTPGLNLSFVIIFFDEKGNRLHHSIIQGNKNNLLDVPEHAEVVRVGFRVYQGGQCVVNRLLIGEKDLSPENILGHSDVLLVTNNYPSYQDLYRNGFVHSRVKAYREHDVDVDVFRFKKDQPVSWHEFQDIDVVTGSQIALRRMLDSGRYRHVLVHFLDVDMWEVLVDFIDSIKVTVWVHGAEIHPWHRRKYNIQTPEQEKAAIAASEIRMAFWHSVLNPMHPNLKLIFVSKYFAEEVMEDLGYRLPETQYQVIHNPINTKLFNYIPKPAEQRKKILSIRPFASRQYANDLTVAAIVELSKEPFFNELEFRIIGDGPLYEETVAPIISFNNVTLEKRFVSQPEIAVLHKEYGVFLCPTRWDSQGVSRDEAMASGLVVITTNTAAIPEFTDTNCAVVVDAEAPVQIAAKLAELVNSEELFLKISDAARKRIQRTLDNSIIVAQEVKVFNE